MTLRIDRYDSIEAARDIVVEWQALLDANHADILFHPNWLEAWLKHIAPGRSLSILAVYDDSRMVAVLPFCIARVWVGPLPVLLARFAGPIPYFAVLGMPVLSSHGTQVWRQVMEEATELLGVDLLCMSGISAVGTCFGPISSALAGLSPRVGVLVEETPAHALIPLAPDFSAYLSGLSRKRREKYRKSKAELESRGLVSACLTGAEAQNFFAEFVERHNAQWQSIGRQGHFEDWPNNAAFFAEILAQQDHSGRFYIQRDGSGRFLAAQFCFVTIPTCLALLTARDIAPDVAELGIGPYAQFERIEKVISEGVRQIDSGVGDYAHKTSLGAQMVPLTRIFVYRKGPFVVLRLNLLRWWSWIIDLAYYRTWFLKVLPRLRSQFGLPRRPLWRLWRETRL